MAEGPKVLSFEQLISRFEQPISEYMDGSVRTDDTMSANTREESACCHCMMEHTEQQRCQFQIIARFPCSALLARWLYLQAQSSKE